MAISSVHCSILGELFRHQLVPQRGAILALGQARWGDDQDPHALPAEIKACVADSVRQEELLTRLTAALSLPAPERTIAVTRIFHETFFSPREVLAIDNSEPSAALQYDLNEPLGIGRHFDVVMNYGAAERAFDIAQVLITIHDRTAPGGLMLHQCAFSGWIDQFYYAVQPTLFFDLAAANGYQLLGLFVEGAGGQRAFPLYSRDTIFELAQKEQIAENSMLFAALVKGQEVRPFQIPMQGYYAGSLSEFGMRAWLALR